MCKNCITLIQIVRTAGGGGGGGATNDDPALVQIIPDSKDHGANMGPIWGRQDPGGPHVGSMNFVIWEWFGAIYATTDDLNQ